MGLERYTNGNNPNPAGGGAAHQWTPQEIAAVIQMKINMMDRNHENFTFNCGELSAQGKRKRNDYNFGNGNKRQGQNNQGGSSGRYSNQSGNYRGSRSGNNDLNRDRCTDPFCNRNGKRPNHTNANCQVQQARRQGTWRDNNNQGGRNQNYSGNYNRNNSGNFNRYNGQHNGGGRDNRIGSNRNNNGNRYHNQSQWRGGHHNNNHRGHDNFVADIAGAVLQGMQGQQYRNERSFQIPPEVHAMETPRMRNPYQPPPGYSHPSYGERRA